MCVCVRVCVCVWILFTQNLLENVLTATYYNREKVIYKQFCVTARIRVVGHGVLI